MNFFNSTAILLTTCFSDIIHVLMGRKHPKILLEGHEFEMHCTQKRKTIWYCVFYRKTRCLARATTFGNMLKKENEHNHDPAPSKFKHPPKPLRVNIVT